MNNIDQLMDLDPLEMTNTDIEAIIEYHRKNRAEGKKPKKDQGPEQVIDLQALGILKPKPPTEGIKRRL